MVLIALAVPPPAEQTATRTEKFTAALSKGSVLRIENVSGDIVASPGAAFSATVAISVTATTPSRAQQLLERMRILQTNDGRDTTLTTHWPREAARRAVTARYELTVPKGVDVVLETVQGDVRVRALDGEVSVQSVNGALEVLGARRSVSAKTVNGQALTSVEPLEAAVDAGLITLFDTGAVIVGSIQQNQ